ncbi:MAG: transporter substrate-binding domain-containing protein, partial [Cetobacterium sp.]
MKKFLFLLMSGVISTSILAEKLYVGTNAEFVPYEYLENGKLTGFDIELMEIVAQKSGYEIVWKDMSFDGLIPA